MGLLDRIAETHEASRAVDPVSLEEFGYLLGRSNGLASPTKSGVTVGVDRALGITGWFSGVRYISETLASLPIHTFRRVGGDARSRRSDPSWMTQPDVERPWFSLVEHWAMSLLHRGNAYSFKMRDGLGVVRGLRPIHPDRVKVGQASDGTKVFEVREANEAGDTLPYTTYEVLHIPGLSYNGVQGLDPIRVHAQTLGLLAAQDEYAQRHFGTGNHLNGYISFPGQLDPTRADELKAEWRDLHSGLANAHDFGILGDGATYETIGLNPEQTQLLESRKFGVTELSRMLRLPPHKLYDLERATFSNIEHQSIETVTDSIRPWAVRFESWLNFDPHLLPSRNYVEFSLEGLMRGDAKARAEFYGLGIRDGWMNRNEPRRLENLPEQPGLNRFLVPQNMAVQNDDGTVQPVSEGAEDV